MRDKEHVKSLQRGLKILEILGRSSRWLTLTEIADLCRVNKTATQRFLNTLSALEYIKRDENKRYFLTPKILSIGFNYLNRSDLRTVAQPHIDNLSSVVNKTVNLVILDGTEVLFLYRKEKSRYLKYDIGVGSRLPAYCTSTGKVLLAGLDKRELRKRVTGMHFEAITGKTIRSARTLLKDIEQTRRRGYSICDQELSLDLYSMAVPLLDRKAAVSAAINVTMDARQKNSPEKQVIITKLMHTGQVVSELLGYRGPYPYFCGPHRPRSRTDGSGTEN